MLINTALESSTYNSFVCFSNAQIWLWFSTNASGKAKQKYFLENLTIQTVDI